jgi:hypothetical protein
MIWWRRDDNIATPVIVFDQFKAVLTSGSLTG